MKIKLKIQKRDLQTLAFISRVFISLMNGIEMPSVQVHRKLPTGITAKAIISNLNNGLLVFAKSAVSNNHQKPTDKVKLSLDINTVCDLARLNGIVETNTVEQTWFTEILTNAIKFAA